MVVVVTSKNRESVSMESLHSCQILVATSCAGTGLDIGSVTQIVIVGLPYSVEQLVQWAGRCRGDGFISVFTAASHMRERTELSGKNDENAYNLIIAI
jgi:superfamily II DNA/RNA helicase